MRSVALALALSALAAAPSYAAPIVGTETPRGAGTLVPLPAQAPAAKTVDGLVGDWAGTGAGYGGVTVRSAGELIYTDHLFDAWGADDGTDAERLAQMEPVTAALPETYRLEAIMRNDPAGQVGAPSPEQLQYLDHYGDLPRDTRADLTELRLAPCDGGLCVLARTATMRDAGDSAVVLLIDTEAGGADREVPFGAGVRTQRAEYAVELSGASGRLADLRTGAVTELASVATNPEGWTNAIEARLPFADVLAVAAAARRPGEPLANVAFRHDEPVREWMEKRQALALHAGSIDEFFQPVDLAALAAGASERFRPGPGYHERVFTSTEEISREEGVDGILQHYGVYLPESLDATRPAPLQLWLHWRGGTAHSAGHTIPGMFRDLGEAHGTIVVSPAGRGTSSWYVGRGQVDVEQVWEDAHRTFSIDPRRRYVAGHSMGGWGSFLMTILHPDRFAAALPASPPVTQGAWTGIDFDQCDEFRYDDYSPCYVQANGGDARAQHTRRLLENVRHVPWAIYHGLEDELVPYSGVARQVERLVQLGYRHRFYTFMTQEHFGPPVWDEWKEGGDYMHRFVAPESPARVSYVRDMPFERATERGLSFTFDGAYWLDGLRARDEVDGRATFEGRSLAVADPAVVTAPEAAGPTAVGNAGPFVMTGLQWLANPLASVAPTSNGFEAALTGANAATLDVGRMRVDAARTVTGKVTADGPLTLTLRGFQSMPLVTVNGLRVPVVKDGKVISFELPAGTSDVRVLPRR